MIVLNAKKVHNTLTNYFAMLRNTGFASKAATRRVLAQILLNEWMNSDMSYFMEEKDYNIIAHAVRNITGDCLIPYTNYCTQKAKVGIATTQIGSPMLMGTSTLEIIRYTQSDNVRFAESNPVRLVEGEVTLGD